MADTFDRDQLIVRILEKHRVIGEGQTATDGQRAVVDKTIDPGIEELRRRGVVSLNANFDMPIEYQEALADYLSYYSAKDFSMPPDLAGKTYAETQLRFIQAEQPTFESVQVDPLHGPSKSAGYPYYYRGGYR